MIQYKVTGKAVLNSKLGALTYYVVASEGTSALGSTRLVAYYNEQVGFVKLAYTNIDHSSLTLELQRVE